MKVERFCASVFYFQTSEESAVDSSTIMVRSGLDLAVVFGLLVASLGMSQRVIAAGEGATPSTPSHPSTPTIVFGFMGGFVGHDDARHPAVKFVEELRKEYPGVVDAQVFENRKYRDAYKAIRQRLDQDQDGILSDGEKRLARILLFGTSWGGSAVVYLARRLNEDGIPVLLTVQIDSVTKIGPNDAVIPPNVRQAVNYYQRHGWVRGRKRIVAADPSRTKILGNFLLSYDKDPVACEGFPWYDNIVTKTHVETECDPKVWSDIEALVRRELPEPNRPPASSTSKEQLVISHTEDVADVSRR